jgi:hypothetical protein
MPPQTRKALNAPRRRTRTLKARLNEEITVKRATKRVKSAKFIHPDKIPTKPSPDERSSSPEEVEECLDVFNLEYTLIWVCMLGSVVIVGDTDLYKLGKFHFREFIHLTIKKVTKATEKAKFDFEWDSGIATLQTKGVSRANAMPIIVEDEEGWKKVERFIEKAMRDKKVEIVVRLTVNYQKKVRDQEDMDEDEDGGGPKVYLNFF